MIFKKNLFKDHCKSNANYGNLVYDEAEKRVAKNLLCDSCLTLELG